jgi:hypothetical protein
VNLLNKKANGSVIILIIVIILFGAIEIMAHPEVFAPRECSVNQDCLSSQYCGSDFKCHEIPPKDVVNYYNDYATAGLAIAIAIIIAAIIIRVKGIERLKEFVHKEEVEQNNKEEPKYIRIG